MLSTVGTNGQLSRDCTIFPEVVESNTAEALKWLGSQEMGVLAKARLNIRHFKPGQTLIDQGQPCANVLIMLEGWALCDKFLEDGSRQILDLALPGDILGFHLKGDSPYSVEAKTDCNVAMLPRAAFHAMLLRVPDLCLKCAELFASAEARAFQRLSRIGRRSARKRVAGFIVELVDRLRAIQGFQSNTIELPLTQIDIADMLGLAHETVCRVLVSLRAQKIAALRMGKLVIHDFERLANAAGVDSGETGLEICPRKLPQPELRRAA